MSLRINTNIDSLTAYRNLTSTQNSMSTSIERLSSGLRINKAADDAAGLAISQGLTSQINGIGQAVRNAQDGINVVQTADGALNETQSILQRMRTLAVQSANDSNDSKSRADIQKEVTALNSELDSIASKTTFNNINLLDGSFKDKQFQVGYASGDTLNVDITQGGSGDALTLSGANANVATAGNAVFTEGTSVTTVALGVTHSASETAAALNADDSFAAAYEASVSTDSSGVESLTIKAKDGGAFTAGTALSGSSTTVAAKGFSSGDLGVGGIHLDTDAATSTAAIATIDTAIQNVSTARANLGALQNRFQHHINNLSVTQENLQASNSAITDTDMAQEMSNYSRTQILSQAGTSMLKQANQASQGVLSLLQ